MAQMPGKFFVNDTVPLDFYVAAVDGDAFDPTTVTVKFMSPHGIETDYVYGTDAELVRDATGTYHIEFVPDKPGRWFFRWEGTGSGARVYENSFLVQTSVFYPDNDCRFDYPIWPWR